MKFTKWIILVAIISCQVGILKSQVEIKKFGLGLHIERLKWRDNYFSDEVNKILFTYSPNQHLRIEPEFGFITGKNDNLCSKIYCYGIGVSGMMQRNKLNLYSGFRFNYSKIQIGYPMGNDMRNQFSIGPHLGLECLLYENFTLGGEFGLNGTMDITNDPYDVKETYISYHTEAGMFFRFYF